MQISFTIHSASQLETLIQAVRDQRRELRGMAKLVHATDEEKAGYNQRADELADILQSLS